MIYKMWFDDLMIPMVKHEGTRVTTTPVLALSLGTTPGAIKKLASRYDDIAPLRGTDCPTKDLIREN